jgi:hypothetical protein
VPQMLTLPEVREVPEVHEGPHCQRPVPARGVTSAASRHPARTREVPGRTTSRWILGSMLGWKRTSGMVTVRLPTTPAAPNTGAEVPTAPGSFSPPSRPIHLTPAAGPG